MIGEEVRRRREGLGLTGAQLAERAGMAPSAVSQIETGKRSPSSASVIKLAAALGVEVGALYPKGQAPLPEFDQDRREGMQEAPIIKPSAASAHLQTTAMAKMLLEVLEDIEQGRTEEAAAKVRQLIAA